MNQLTKTETKYLKMLDRRDIRIRIAREAKNKSKWPLIENWTVYYSEPLTISQMLEKGYNWGIRTGKKVGDYYFIVIDLDDLWAKERIKTNWIVETNKGIHRYFLIRELPRSCWLVNQQGDKIGEIHSLGRQVVGIGSIHEKGTRYTLKERVNQKWKLKIESLKELQTFLTERNIKTAPWGKEGLKNIRDLEPYYPRPKKVSKETKYFQKKEELEKQVNRSPKKENLNICYLCLVYFAKESRIIKEHLQGKGHQKNWKIYQEKKRV